MDEEKAKQLIESMGYSIDSIKFVSGAVGRNCVFDLELSNGDACIAKFEGEKYLTSEGVRRDFYYNGILSLERQAALCTLVRKIGLPSPDVKGIHKSPEGSFLLVSKLQGIPWGTFTKINNHSLQKYLQSLEFLGSDIAQAQNFHFE